MSSSSNAATVLVFLVTLTPFLFSIVDPPPPSSERLHHVMVNMMDAGIESNVVDISLALSPKWRWQLQWDDTDNFVENAHIQNLTAQNLRWIWREGVVHGVFEPIAQSLKLGVVMVFGLRPIVFLRLSVLLHAFSSALAFRLALALLRLKHRKNKERAPLSEGEVIGSAIGALLFGVHPLRCEAVGWLSCQPFLLAGLLAILSIRCHVNVLLLKTTPRVFWWRWLSVLLFLLAVLSKAAVVPLPVVLVSIEFYTMSSKQDAARRGKIGAVATVVLNGLKACVHSWPHFAVALAGAWWAIDANRHHAGNSIPALSIGQSVVRACYSLGWYPRMTLLPEGLDNLYPVPLNRQLLSVTSFDFALSCAVVAVALPSAAFFILTRHSCGGGGAFVCSLAFAAYVSLLSPFLGPVGHGWVVMAADRYSYLPALIPVPFCGHVMHTCCGGAKRRRRLVLVAMLSCALLAWSGSATSDALESWRSPVSLWSRAAGQRPDSASVHSELGVALLDMHRQMLVMTADNDDASSDFFFVDAAIDSFRRSRRANPKYSPAHSNLAVALRTKGTLNDEALESFRAAAQLSPSPSKAALTHYNLANALRDLGRLDEAEVEYRRAAALDQGIQVHAMSNLASGLSKAGKLPDARNAMAEALLSSPENPVLLHNYGVISMKLYDDHNSPSVEGTKLLVEAEKAFQRASSSFPDSPHAADSRSALKNCRQKIADEKFADEEERHAQNHADDSGKKDSERLLLVGKPREGLTFAVATADEPALLNVTNLLKFAPRAETAEVVATHCVSFSVAGNTVVESCVNASVAGQIEDTVDITELMGSESIRYVDARAMATLTVDGKAVKQEEEAFCFAVVRASEETRGECVALAIKYPAVMAHGKTWRNDKCTILSAELVPDSIDENDTRADFGQRSIPVGISWPIGETSGWGVAGEHIAQGLLSSGMFTPVPLSKDLTQCSREERRQKQQEVEVDFGSAIEGTSLPVSSDASLVVRRHAATLIENVFRQRTAFQPMSALNGAADSTAVIAVPFPVLHALGRFGKSARFDSMGQIFAGRTSYWSMTLNVGILFFETTNWSAEEIHRLLAFDVVLVGSTWNREILIKLHGVPKSRLRVFLQGVDSSVFRSEVSVPTSLLPPSFGFTPPKSDRSFVIFSGGKLEHRKGQDITIEAFRRFEFRNPGVGLLVTSWQHDSWPHLVDDFARRSPYVDTGPNRTDGGGLDVEAWLQDLPGIPSDGVVALPRSLSHVELAAVLGRVDVAVFPNRCEGGTNLVLMEALVSGVPGIVSPNTGHLDLFRLCPAMGSSVGAPLRLGSQGIVDGGRASIGWGESDPDEIVQGLEWVLKNPDVAKDHAREVARCVADKLPWRASIDSLLQTLRQETR